MIIREMLYSRCELWINADRWLCSLCARVPCVCIDGVTLTIWHLTPCIRARYESVSESIFTILRLFVKWTRVDKVNWVAGNVAFRHSHMTRLTVWAMPAPWIRRITSHTNKNRMPPICLTLIDDTAYVFNADGKSMFGTYWLECCVWIRFHHHLDYMKIRCSHRIVGKLIGCSVKWPRNTNLSGNCLIFSSQLRS